VEDPALNPNMAINLLRMNHTATLLCDDVPHTAGYVIEAGTGRLVMPVPMRIPMPDSHVLFIPDESDEALQLLVDAEPADPDRDEACDRWRIYHGEPRWPRWMVMAIDSAKLAGEVIDGSALMKPNPLRDVEPGICRVANGRLDALRELCRRRIGVAPVEPRLVGVDPLGMDVRARFGVVRLIPDRPVSTPEDMAALLDAVAGDGA
jgi:hypothetical protein